MFYKIGGVEYDSNSLKNQSIKSKFVGREVYCLVNDFMDACFKLDEFIGQKDDCLVANIDTIENFTYYTCPHCNSEVESEEGECENCGKDYEYTNIEYNDVFEWYIVSEMLGEKLKARRHVIFERYPAPVWGRCTTGQAIMLDGVIDNICHEMGILEGQEYEWSE